jgi:hypothetical protein
LKNGEDSTFEEGTPPNLGGTQRQESLGWQSDASQLKHTLLSVVSSFQSLPMSKLIVKGPKQEYINQLRKLTPSFNLYYERLGENGPLLLWPEFEYMRDINIPDRQEAFNCFRAFLEEWASDAGPWSSGDNRTPISIAFEDFEERPTSRNQALSLPKAFDFKFAFSNSLTPPTRESSTSLTTNSKRRASPLADESRRKRRGLGSSVLGSSRGLNEVGTPVLNSCTTLTFLGS